MKECRVCGKLSQSYYCSKEHQTLWYKEHPRHTKICLACGKEFKTNDPKQEYCSGECARPKPGANNGLDSFIERFSSRFGSEFEYVDGYVNCESTINIRCKTCGDVFEWNAQVVRRKNKTITCRHCAEVVRRVKQAAIRDGVESKQRLRAIQKIISVLKAELKNKERYDRLTVVCTECGTVFRAIRFSKNHYCSDICRRRSNNRRKEIQRRHKLRENGLVDYSISLSALIKRDHNRCHICGELCDCDDYTFSDAGWFIAGERYPSIDHVLPVSKGGTHSWDNVKLAHRKCNSLKSDADPKGLPITPRGPSKPA